MPEQMQVARFIKAGEPLEVGTMDKPTPGPRQVLVKVDFTSLVPNTKNIVNGVGVEGGVNLPNSGHVFGLDAAGVVEAVGEHVLEVKVGQRVYVNPFLTCDSCRNCRRGRNDMCSYGMLRGYFAFGDGGNKHLQQWPIGALSQYVLSPESKVASLPDSIDSATAARFGYIGTSFGGLKKGKVGPSKTVLIHGVTGTLGFAAVAIALGLGATKILGIGRNKERLQQVENLSPSKGRVVVVSSEEEKDLVGWVKKQTGGVGVDCFYDCLGVGGDANTTSKLISGAIVVGGYAVLAAGGAEAPISRGYSAWMMQEVILVGTNWFQDAEIDELIALVAAGVIDLSFLEKKEFALKDVNKALEFVGDRPGGSVNVVVNPN